MRYPRRHPDYIRSEQASVRFLPSEYELFVEALDYSSSKTKAEFIRRAIRFYSAVILSKKRVRQSKRSRR